MSDQPGLEPRPPKPEPVEVRVVNPPEISSVGKILQDAATNPKALGPLILFGITVIALVTGGATSLAWALSKVVAGNAGSEVSISALSSGITITSGGIGGGAREEHLLVVHPRGWQATPVSVEPGDVLTFTATGSVHISLNSIVEHVEARHLVEDSVVADPPPELGPGEGPEVVLSDAVLERLRLPRPWLTPAGDGTDSISALDHAFSGRTRYKAMPDEGYGALVGRFQAGSQNGTPFLIGEGRECMAHAGGNLSLAVNDVFWQTEDGDMWFINDNLGMFFVTIRVEDRAGITRENIPRCNERPER